MGKLGISIDLLNKLKINSESFEEARELHMKSEKRDNAFTSLDNAKRMVSKIGDSVLGDVAKDIGICALGNSSFSVDQYDVLFDALEEHRYHENDLKDFIVDNTDIVLETMSVHSTKDNKNSIISVINPRDFIKRKDKIIKLAGLYPAFFLSNAVELIKLNKKLAKLVLKEAAVTDPNAAMYNIDVLMPFGDKWIKNLVSKIFLNCDVIILVARLASLSKFGQSYCFDILHQSLMNYVVNYSVDNDKTKELLKMLDFFIEFDKDRVLIYKDTSCNIIASLIINNIDFAIRNFDNMCLIFGDEFLCG